MRWSDVNAIRRVALGVVLAASFWLVQVGPAMAQDSEVGATVCGRDAPGAAIAISQPLDDSISEQSPVTFRGTVNNASQVEISIDGALDRTIAISANQMTFSIDLALSRGTHTITMYANDICGGESSEDSVVVTYEPAAEPSDGGTTPTVLEPGTSAEVVTGETLDGTSPLGRTIEDNKVAQGIEQFPLLGAAVSVVSDFGRAIGLESTLFANNTNIAVGFARVGLTVAALTSVVAASTLAPLAASNIPWVGDRFKLSSNSAMGRLGWGIRVMGIAAFCLACIL